MLMPRYVYPLISLPPAQSQTIDSLNKNYSTAIEGDVTIDILFVANDLDFKHFRDQLEQNEF